LSFCPFLTPSIECFIPFNQHGHERVVGNPFGEVRMLPDERSNSVTSSAFFCSKTFMENLLVGYKKAVCVAHDRARGS
jgi:hypothetical protein